MKDIKLFAKYGDRTIDAVVIDDAGMEILNGFKVKIGDRVGDIALPLVSSNNLEFEGWYDGNTKLNADDVITENMSLICKFKVVEEQTSIETSEEPSVEPSINQSEEPSVVTSDKTSNETSSESPEKPKKKGCKSDLSFGFSFISLLVLAGSINLRRKAEKRW